MAYIEHYTVIDPPTSSEVEVQTLRKLGESGVLQLVMLPDRDVPVPKEIEVYMNIRQTTHPKLGGMVISGTDNIFNDILTLRTDPDGIQPAHASWVKA